MRQPDMRVFGMAVYVNDALCKKRRMVLDPKVAACLTPEFRKEMDEWMESFFGYKHEVLMVDPSLAGLPGEKHVVTSLGGLELLKKAYPKRTTL